MPEPSRVIAVVTAYMALLFAVALFAERQERRGRRVASNALVYSLSQAVYCTTWTYYGSVGSAASSGLLFLTIYLGPTLVAIFGWPLLRKLVRIKNARRVTSLADLLSLRYGKSQAIAALATAILVLGLIPYLALQLKTMIATVALITGDDPARTYPAIGGQVGPPIVLLMILFTIVFGLRRVSPTERHPGLIVALAVECAVKLVAFLAAGAFVTYGLFHGFGDIFQRAARAGPPTLPPLVGPGGTAITWLTHLVLSASAILFLPRQFHVAVVENSDERHIRTSMWLFPAYLLAINVFVLPLALGGLLLGHPATMADSFVLRLPYDAGRRGLSWLVFLGGFSAGTGMVMVETVALATMISNHLLLPAADAWRRLEPLRRHLVLSRWFAAAVIICVAFGYERAFGYHGHLIDIGTISFAAVLQLAPAALGALYWAPASKSGAFAGLLVGFGTWAYTLVVPLLARSGWLPASILIDGPAGIGILRPEALFGMGGYDRMSHAVLWSLLLNVGTFVLVSLLYPEGRGRPARTTREAMDSARGRAGDGPVIADAAAKGAQIARLFGRYHSDAEASRLAEQSFRAAGVEAGPLTALQLARLLAEVETALASSIGAAAAHAAVKREALVTPDEARSISRAYAEILADLHVSPAELQRRLDYHRERERLLARDAATQHFLADVSGRLAGSLDVEITTRTVAHLPVPELVEAALLWLPQAETGGARVEFAHADAQRERLAAAALEGAAPALARHPVLARALDSGRPVVSASALAPEWPNAIHDAGPFTGDVTLPLPSGHAILGTLTLFLSEGSRIRLPDLGTAEELARRSAMALENAWLFQSAREAVRSREEFLAVASHELKTPVTPLRLSIQTLQRLVRRGDLKSLPPERLEELFGAADAQICRLVRLIDDLLDISRLTANRLKLQLEPTDLSATIAEVVERHRSELSEAGCAVTVEAPPAVVGQWDRFRVEQVFTNLLSNAMKYAAGGAIEVRIGADERVARVTIRDQGPGIALEDQERIFRPFERAVSYLEVSGFGLGLYIVRQIVDAHGGSVLLDSTPGRGSAFTVELPRNPPRVAA